MDNILEYIKNVEKQEEDTTCFHIRFNDLRENKKNGLMKTIIRNSSLRTIRRQQKINESQISEILEATNPIIWSISKNYCYMPLYKWTEKRLSQLIYHYWRVAFKQKKPNKTINWLTRRLITRI